MLPTVIQIYMFLHLLLLIFVYGPFVGMEDFANVKVGNDTDLFFFFSFLIFLNNNYLLHDIV